MIYKSGRYPRKIFQHNFFYIFKGLDAVWKLYVVNQSESTKCFFYWWMRQSSFYYILYYSCFNDRM
jgi:hypothetical protein